MINFGIIKETLSSLFLKESNQYGDTNAAYKSYVELLKNSEILKQEFKVYKTLEDTKFENREIAKIFLEKILEPFKSYTYNEVTTEITKLKNLVTNPEKLEDDKSMLFTSIDNLILSSTKDGIFKPDVKDNFEKSLNTVLTYITQPQVLENQFEEEEEMSEEELGYIKSDEIMEKSLELYENEYSEQLNETQKDFIGKLFKTTDEEKPLIFEQIKQHVINKLTEDTDSDEQLINECIAKIVKMKFNENLFYENVTDLLDFC
jgi:hypothetical protein